MIAYSRTKEVQENYHKIGGGSPIVRWSALQGSGMVERLRARGHDVEYALAMRYWNPTTDEALKALEGKGVDRLLALTLYPHYSIATTGSSVAELKRAMRRRGTKLPLDVIESWYDQPTYIRALVERTKAALAGFPADTRPTLLFSAHGLPQHFIDAGDPYCGHIQATIDAMRAALPDLPHTLAYQSRVGPVPWIGPATEQAIDRLAAEGVRDLLVIPISFVSDHIETLYEVDMLYGDQARARGITNFRRIESLNDFPTFLDALADVAATRLS